MATRREGVPGARWERAAAATGIAFVVFGLIAFLIVPAPPQADASTEEVLSYFADNDSGLLWQAFLFGLAGFLFLWFGGTLASALRRAEGDPSGRLPAIAFGGFVASTALYFVGVAASAALAKASDGEGATRALFDLADMAFGLTNFTAAVIAGAVSLAILRTKLFADWVAWAGLLLVAAGIVDGAVQIFSDSDAGEIFGIVVFLSFLGWILLTSFLLTRHAGRR